MIRVECREHHDASDPDCTSCGYLRSALRSGKAMVAAVHSDGPGVLTIWKEER